MDGVAVQSLFMGPEAYRVNGLAGIEGAFGANFFDHMPERLTDSSRGAYPIDVGVGLGGGLDVDEIVSLGEGLSLFGRHLSLVFEVALVGDKDADEGIAAMVIEVSEPVFDVEESVPLRDVVHQEHSCRASIIHTANGSELFLPALRISTDDVRCPKYAVLFSDLGLGAPGT